MTDSDKLKALIELASNNGFDIKQCAYFTLGHDMSLIPETVIFSHDFIKSLCKSAEHIQVPPGLRLMVIEPWIAVIQSLAISTNRINYLWEVFGK